MNRHAAIELDWADGTHTFRLGLAELEELEDKRDQSIFTLATRLSPGVRSARSKDIIEVLRIGLIGGGLKPVEALALVRRYVDERSLDENRDVAYAVTLAAISRVYGEEIKPPGEAPAAGSTVSTSPPSGAEQQ
jgi:hypothetical protein